MFNRFIRLVALPIVTLVATGDFWARQADGKQTGLTKTVLLPVAGTGAIHIPDGETATIGGKIKLTPVAARRMLPAAVPSQQTDENSALLLARHESGGTVHYEFRINTHSMQLAVGDSGLIRVGVQFDFRDQDSLSEIFPELKMDYDQFPTRTNDGSSVQLAVRVTSNYEFEGMDEFEKRLPKMNLLYELLKDSEPQSPQTGLSFGGVTPRVIIQAEEEEIPLQRLVPAQKKDGG